jgi:hypothetical protein
VGNYSTSRPSTGLRDITGKACRIMAKHADRLLAWMVLGILSYVDIASGHSRRSWVSCEIQLSLKTMNGVPKSTLVTKTTGTKRNYH